MVKSDDGRSKRKGMTGNPHGIDYTLLDTEEITAASGIPIDDAHQWAGPFNPKEIWMMERWARWLRRKGDPHATVVFENVGPVIFRHMWVGGRYGDPGKPAGFCCGKE